MKVIMGLAWLLVLFLAILFVSINSQFVTVHYYIGQINAYFPLLLLLFLMAGALLALFAFIPVWLRIKNKQRQLHSTIKNLNQEIINLRNIPIKDVD